MLKYIHTLALPGKCAILLDHMNSIRPSIQFTIGKEAKNQLAFLEVQITHTVCIWDIHIL